MSLAVFDCWEMSIGSCLLASWCGFESVWGNLFSLTTFADENGKL